MKMPVGASLIAELLDRHGAALELYASQWTHSPEDAVQEAFVELARQTEVPQHLVAWLYRVVRHRAINAVRASSRRLRHEQEAARLGDERRQQAMGKADKLSLPEALDALPASDREIVVLRIWSGLTWQQIAAVSQISSSSAQRQYVAALEQLRKFLEPSCLPNLVCRRD